MTQEDKELLLRDLCGRLPYGAIPRLLDMIELTSKVNKTSDPELEPKFKVGDWVVYDHRTYQVVELPKEGYINLGLRRNGKVEFAPSPYCRHWSIADAKDGDILATWAGAFIYNGNNDGSSCPGSYCGINTLGRFQIGGEKHWTGKKVYPATKEQRELFFSKMKKAGYEWNSEKKELKKIEHKMLDADEVIEWVKTKVYDDSTYGMAMIDQFKKDFGL